MTRLTSSIFLDSSDIGLVRRQGGGWIACTSSSYYIIENENGMMGRGTRKGYIHIIINQIFTRVPMFIQILSLNSSAQVKRTLNYGFGFCDFFP